MQDRLMTVGAAFLLVAGGFAVALNGCSDESAIFEPGAGATGGATGGAGGGGEGPTTGGAGGEGAGEAECPHEGPPIIDPGLLPACDPECGGAHCVPSALVPADLQSQLAPCGEDGFCTPDNFIASGGNLIPDTCVSAAGAEGRCLSECLPAVAEQLAILPLATCAEGERCVPCFDPLTQEDTGACSVSCDPGPQEPPVEITCPWDGPQVIDPSGLPACDPECGGAHCLPEAYVSPAEAALLAPCPGGYCAPDTLAVSGGQGLPPSCLSVAGAEGRCLSTCIPDVAAEPLLPQSTCAADERCVPCYNPTDPDPTLSTGACELACDEPIEDPVLLTCPWTGPAVIDPASLPECDPVCGGAHCLPADQVPPDQQALLTTCTGGFCVPDPIIATGGNVKPATCSPFPSVTAEGRCQSTCLPDVAAQASSLRQDVCATEELCVPCYDPFTGEATGACSSSSCDAPVDPVYTFPTCCPNSANVDEATCVPTGMIPDDDEADLNQLSCPTDTLCVPNEYLPNPTVPIATCTAVTGAGVCVSECTSVPNIFSQRDCSDNHVCVPCWLAPSTPGC